DSEDDARLLVRELDRGRYAVAFEWVDTAAAMSVALEREAWDMIIADYAMPGFNGTAALALFRGKGLDLPFIIVSGAIGEDIAVKAMKAGANDYVMKGNMARLVPAVRRELREAQVRRERKRLRRRCSRHTTIWNGLWENVPPKS
ncbi:MAG: response regulator, partial [Syntrophales bacterium LBB04]|nr:response regulator [Syntrophales bacterium LBB04]